MTSQRTGSVTPSIEVRAYGDSSLLATARGGDPEQRWLSVHRLASELEHGQPPGVNDAITTYDSILIEFDCEITDHGTVEAWLRRARPADGHPSSEPRRFEVPVVYGGDYGPDLLSVADQMELNPREVVELHSGSDWVVRFLGAPVGAPMMDGSPLPRPVSRCPEPRTHVPAGSVALAGLQGVIYPVLTPGGWRLIGRTPRRLVDVTRQPLVPYWPGDVFRFVPIHADRWTDHLGDLEPCDG